MSIQNFQHGHWLERNCGEATIIKLPGPHSGRCTDLAYAGTIALVQRFRHLIKSATETDLVTTSCRAPTANGYGSEVMAYHARDWQCGALITVANSLRLLNAAVVMAIGSVFE